MRALVISGGGMRGAYASGAVAHLQEVGEEFDSVYGTSVGGAMAAWFTAGQAADGLRTWPYARDKRVLNYTRWLTGRGPLVDLEHLYNHVYLNEVGLDVAAIARARNPGWVTVADVDDGRGHRLDLRTNHVPEALRATSAIPLATQGPVEIHGRRYLDGGVTDPVPLKWALEDGAREITVLLNHPPGPRAPTHAAVLWYFRRKYPALADAAARHAEFYMQADQVLAAPPPGVRLRVIRPTHDTGLSRFTRDMEIIRAAIEQGRQDAHRALESFTVAPSRPSGEAFPRTNGTPRPPRP